MSLVDIQTPTAAQSASGEETLTWTDTLPNISARVSPTGGNETRVLMMTYNKASHVITLQGKYDVTTKMRVVEDTGEIYNIVAVLSDDCNIFTKLVCEVVV
jgi:SPP1 family predicted phage head-tail adaptor